MNKKEFKISLILILFITSVLLVPMTFSKYFVTYTRSVTLNISKPTYNIVFHSNTSPDQTVTQTFTYGTAQNLRNNTFTNGTNTFVSWNTSADGSGTSYSNNQQVNNLSSTNGDVIDLYAIWSSGVASINGVTYSSIRAAINAVPTTGVETTIVVLGDVQLTTAEKLIIPNTKNIVLDLNGHTVSNVSKVNIPLIENNGTLRITNGNLSSDAEQGVINNNSGAHLSIDSTNVTATGSKQALYNDGGHAVINSGTFYNVSTNRAAVQNQASGTLIIKGGSIVSQSFYGVQSAGTLVIGEEDGTVSRTTPEIRGSYGVYATSNFEFYDGILMGKTAPVNDTNRITSIETGYDLTTSSVSISNTNYSTLYLSTGTITINFNGNGGTPSEASRVIEPGTAIGGLPTATYANYVFDAWYDDPVSGNRIDPTTVFNSGTTLYAHWVTGVAEVNGVFYDTIQNALASITTSNQTTISLYDDVSFYYVVNNNRNLVFDLRGHTISVNDVQPVFTNNGTLKLMNGTVTTNVRHAAVNNNSTGSLELSNVQLIATGTRQALYNDGGTAVINGGSVLSAVSTERSAITNLNNGHLTILDATVLSTGLNGIDNTATLTIGEKDGTINSNTPVIRGKDYGVNNSSVFNFYDGTLKGIISSLQGNLSDTETGSSEVNGTEVIDGLTYITKTLSN